MVTGAGRCFLGLGTAHCKPQHVAAEDDATTSQETLFIVETEIQFRFFHTDS